MNKQKGKKKREKPILHGWNGAMTISHGQRKCGKCKKMIAHKGIVRKRIAAYLSKVKKEHKLLKDVSKEDVDVMLSYILNEYRNPHQIKAGDGKLADYTVLLFEEKVKAMFNRAVRMELITSNHIHSLTKAERCHAPNKHREFLTPEELMRFLSVETATENERSVQLAFGLSCMTRHRLGGFRNFSKVARTFRYFPEVCGT